jgi:ADP-ribose pyrophosphatase YjhB (NUDIX family)
MSPRAAPEPSPTLLEFFSAYTPVSETRAVWGGGTIHLRITSYFAEALPPLEYVSSVRCIVFRGDQVLVVREGEQAHVVPGGRRERGETLAQTLERELLEETGWTIAEPRQIGVVWLHHLSPRPPSLAAYSPHYPDFLWIIYIAEAAQERPDALLPGNPEGIAGFVPLADVDAFPLGAESRLFLERALEATGRTPL